VFSIRANIDQKRIQADGEAIPWQKLTVAELLDHRFVPQLSRLSSQRIHPHALPDPITLSLRRPLLHYPLIVVTPLPDPIREALFHPLNERWPIRNPKFESSPPS
jgi:hypothetical protein